MSEAKDIGPIGNLTRDVVTGVRDHFRPTSVENAPVVPEWDGIIEVGKTKTRIAIHGDGFERITDANGKETVRIKEGITPIFVNIGWADDYRYRPFDQELVRNGYTVVGWDPPGQKGRSEYLRDENDKIVPHNMDEYAKFQNNLYSSLTNGKVDIIAMSQGGVPTEMFAAAHPEKVNKLVLVGTFAAIRGQEFAEKIKRELALKPTNATISLEKIIKILIYGPELPPEKRPEAERRFLNPAWLAGHASTTLEAIASLLYADATEDCGKITAPTLLLAGKKDELAPIKGMEELNVLIPNSKLVTVDTGHVDVLGNDKTFNPESMNAILSHLKT